MMENSYVVSHLKLCVSHSASKFMQDRVAKVNDQVPDRPPFVHSLDLFPDELMTYIDGLLDSLSQSVYLRVRDIPFHKYDSFSVTLFPLSRRPLTQIERPSTSCSSVFWRH